MEELESRIFSEKPNPVDVTIIDAMFLLHLWKDLPATYQQRYHAHMPTHTPQV